MNASSSAGCGLHFLGESIHLVTYAYAAEVALAPHFLRHYVRLGVPVRNMRVFIDAGNGSSTVSRSSPSLITGEGLRRALLEREWLPAMLRTFAGANVTVVRGSYSERLKLSVINGHVVSLALGSFLINADIDEHFSYPCDMPARLAEFDVWRAYMVDQLSPSGAVEPVRAEGELQAQFPLMCFLRSHLRVSIHCTKVAIVAVLPRKGDGPHRTFDNVHEVRGEWGAMRGRPLPLVSGGGALAHFTLTQQALQTLLNKKFAAFKSNPTQARDYAKILSFLREHMPGTGHDARGASQCKGPFGGNRFAAHYTSQANWERFFPCRCTNTTKSALKQCGCRDSPRG